MQDQVLTYQIDYNLNILSLIESSRRDYEFSMWSIVGYMVQDVL